MSIYFVNRAFSNTLLFGLLSVSYVSSAHGVCKTDKVTLDAMEAAPLGIVSGKLQELTGCNLIIEKQYQDYKLTLVAGSYDPVSLLERISKRLKANFTKTSAVLALTEKGLNLKDTGKVVSVDLNDAPVESVNQIIKKLGGTVFLEPSEKKITQKVSDIPLDDLVPVLEVFIKNGK